MDTKTAKEIKIQKTRITDLLSNADLQRADEYVEEPWNRQPLLDQEPAISSQ